MQIFLLTALTMIAFAANSVLNRMALADGAIDPASFAVIRMASGAGMLVLLIALRGGERSFAGAINVWAVLGLAAYMLGFSFAYVALDAGTGALILFGGVQITMFGGAVWAGTAPKTLQWLGSGIAFCGLAFLLAPSAVAPPLNSALLMGVAAAGWGIYSIAGKQAVNPLFATGANFCAALPIGVIVWLFVAQVHFSTSGIVLAALSGAVTSALGYALWYAVLPRLQMATAAVAQLSVPLIAAGAGFALLDEPVTGDFVIAACLVLGGIAVSAVSAAKTRPNLDKT